MSPLQPVSTIIRTLTTPKHLILTPALHLFACILRFATSVICYKAKIVRGTPPRTRSRPSVTPHRTYIMEADGTCSANISPTSSSLCLSSETKSSCELPGSFPDGLCTRCQGLKINGQPLGTPGFNHSLRIPYSLEDSLPGLPVLSRSARHGCKFCALLKSIIFKLVSHDRRHQWLGNSLIGVSSKATLSPTYRALRDAGLSYLEVPVKFSKLPHLEEDVQYFIHFEVESMEGRQH